MLEILIAVVLVLGAYLLGHRSANRFWAGGVFVVELRCPDCGRVVDRQHPTPVVPLPASQRGPLPPVHGPTRDATSEVGP